MTDTTTTHSLEGPGIPNPTGINTFDITDWARLPGWQTLALALNDMANQADQADSPVFHRLTFGEAIKRDLLTDYQVAVVGNVRVMQL